MSSTFPPQALSRAQATTPAPFSLDYAAQPCTHNPPWGVLTVLDVLLNNLSLGLFLVACLGLVLLPGNLVSAPAFLLAWGLLLADLALLVLDLGDPWRFHHMLRTVRPLSPIWVGVWALSGAASCMTVPALWGALALMGWIPSTAPVWLAVVLVPAVLCASVGLMYKGVLFTATSRPVWKDARWFAPGLCAGSILLGTGLFALLSLVVDADMARWVLPALFPLLCLDVVWMQRGLAPLFPKGKDNTLYLAATLDVLAGICLIGGLVTQTAFLSVLAVAALVAASWCSRYTVVTA